MVKLLREKLKSHRESQKGTRADTIIQTHPTTHEQLSKVSTLDPISQDTLICQDTTIFQDTPVCEDTSVHQDTL